MPTIRKGDPGFDEAIYNFLHGDPGMRNQRVPRPPYTYVVESDYADLERKMAEMLAAGVPGIQEVLNDMLREDFLHSTSTGTYAQGFPGDVEVVHEVPPGTVIIDAVARDATDTVDPDKRIVVVKHAQR